MRPGPGLFGKVPETGDFVVRGITPPYRRSLDRWVTAHLAARCDGWPKGGVRGLLAIDDALFLMLAVASVDAVGRKYPLLAVTGGAGVSMEDAEVWCDAALLLVEDTVRGENTLNQTFGQLQDLLLEVHDEIDGEPALWLAGRPPMACDTETLNTFFSSD